MSYANSRIPHSAQQGIHEALGKRLDRHFQHPFRKPFAACNLAAFEASTSLWDGRAALILDAGCGVAHSTIALARAHPEAFVIGVDQSAVRLARPKPYPAALLPQNMTLIRADLVDYWRLLHKAGMRLQKHYILYPNPWPKIGHLARRWHAHPVFPTILALGGTLECRTNWRIYAEEFAFALRHGGQPQAAVETFTATEALTPFERKYRDSGQTLYRIRTHLDGTQSPCIPKNL